MAKRKSSANGTVAAPEEPKQRNRNEMWYAIVGDERTTGSGMILATEKTVGRMRKLWSKMSNTFKACANNVRLVRCTVVPFVKPITEETDDESGGE